VLVETYSAALTLAQPPEIELYAWVFDELAAVASSLPAPISPYHP
jgi:hypothetical protein